MIFAHPTPLETAEFSDRQQGPRFFVELGHEKSNHNSKTQESFIFKPRGFLVKVFFLSFPYQHIPNHQKNIQR